MPEVSPMSDRDIPPGLKTDLPLAKAEPVNDSGSASIITHLRGSKKCNISQERGMRICETTVQTPVQTPREEGVGGGVLQTVMKTRVTQVFLL